MFDYATKLMNYLMWDKLFSLSVSISCFTATSIRSAIRGVRLRSLSRMASMNRLLIPTSFASPAMLIAGFARMARRWVMVIG